MVTRFILVHAALATVLVTALPSASAQLQVSGASGGNARTAASGALEAPLLVNPTTGLHYLPDPHQGGGAQSLKIVQVTWGRLVDVYDQSANGKRRVRYGSFLIGHSVQSDGVDYLLEKDPITLQERLTILHPINTAGFELALARAESAAVPLMDKGLAGLPPWTMVARNGALSIQLNDLLDPATVDQDTVKLWTGYPPALPFGCIVMPDPSHGAARRGSFWSTRVLIDLTISTLDAIQHNLPINLVGLPAAVTTAAPNAILRLPTKTSPPAAQFEILRNLSGNGLSLSGNGSNDPSSPTEDIVRAFRSGGATVVTGDPYEGFLPDDEAPFVVGGLGVAVTFVGPPPGVRADGVTIDFTFPTALCASQPLPGDVVTFQAHVLQVTEAAAPPVGTSVQNVRVAVILGDPSTLAPGLASFQTTWDPAELAAPQCFVDFTVWVASGPVVGAGTDFGLSFGEPMQPSSLSSFDTFAVEYGNNPAGSNPIYGRVVGNVVPSINLTRFSFQPSYPLRHMQPSEPYTLRLGGVPGIVDLAGNPLAYPLPPIPFTIDPNQPMIDSLSISLNFSSLDEDGNGAPELRGQFLPDLQRGVIRSRPVSRFSARADPTHLVVGAMVPLSVPVQTPLSPLGSKLMALWRHHDLGLGLLDDATHNLDVEGLWWEPYGGAVLGEQYSQFQMSVGHSERLPDEALNTGLLPMLPQSGLQNTYGGNYLNPFNTGAVVHPKQRGYSIDPLDLTTTPAGRVVAPWPMNRDVPPAQYTYWTWRDTGIQDVGGPFGFGADTRRLSQVGGTQLQSFYKSGQVPTIGLPLLMEFRTYPDNSALGLNGLNIAIAINSSARPYFRTFSTGGLLSNGTQKVVDPDQEVTGSGGVNPSTGTPTTPQDNVFHYGQADFVVRVSRLHSIWFDALGTTQFSTAVSQPSAIGLPPGTQVVLAFRGATDITSATPGSWEDAGNLDPYGDSYTPSQHNKLAQNPNRAFTTTFLNGSSAWTDIFSLAGSRYFQVRVSMIADPETGLAPELSGLGLALAK